MKPQSPCGNTFDHWNIVGGKVEGCDKVTGSLPRGAVGAAVCPVKCDNAEFKADIPAINCNLMKAKKGKIIPKWSPMPPRFNKQTITCKSTYNTTNVLIVKFVFRTRTTTRTRNWWRRWRFKQLRKSPRQEESFHQKSKDQGRLSIGQRELRRRTMSTHLQTWIGLRQRLQKRQK